MNRLLAHVRSILRTTSRQWTQAGMATAAILLGLVGLALPWRGSALSTGFLSTYLPGACHITYDGDSYCDMASVGLANTSNVVGPVSGFAGPARVLLVPAAVLLCVAWRRRSASVAARGWWVACAGLAFGGPVATSGHLVTAAALVLGAAAFDAKLLPRAAARSVDTGGPVTPHLPTG